MKLKTHLYKILFIAIICTSHQTKAQEVSYYDNWQFHPFGKVLYQPGTNYHTSLRPIDYTKLQQLTNVDSILYDGIKVPDGKLNIWKRFLHDDLIKWENEDWWVKINPLFDFNVGKERIENKTTWTNTRGISVDGKLGKSFYFYADFYENQAVFPNYIDDFVRTNKVVPGQGKSKNFANESPHDFSQATGYISFNAYKEYINIQMGNGKMFIGDGHRSLLLSDNAFSYPFLRLNAEFGKIKYMIQWAQHRDLNIDPALEGNDARYPEKYSVSHYLTANIGNRLSLGFFENVVWAAQDTMGYRGFDYTYLNPFAFFRPIEYATGSPDAVTMGLNAKYIVGNKSAFYGQFVLGEFKFDEVFGGNKWWANKHGFQLGFKSFDVFKINKLDFQTEYNQVRPYTYSHRESITNYGHYNQSLAHPLGANFRESVTHIKYQYRRFIFNAEFMLAMYGKDYEDDDISWGKDIYKSNDNRPGDYGHYIGQGLKTNLYYTDLSVSYLINPRNNFNIALGTRLRRESNNLQVLETQQVWFAIRTSLKNLYYDF